MSLSGDDSEETLWRMARGGRKHVFHCSWAALCFKSLLKDVQKIWSC